jgi:zinc transporter
MSAAQIEIVSGKAASGILWVYRFDDDGAAAIVACEDVDVALAAPGGWTWVHVGLSDARARNWLARHAPVSEVAREVLTGADEHLRLDNYGSEFVGTVPDLHQEFAEAGEDLVRLRFVMTDRLLITARRQPVHALELTRRLMEAGRVFPNPMAFVDAVIDQFADAVGRMTETIGDQLDDIEDRLLRESLDDERRRLGRIRLQTARVHRQLSQLYLLFHRLEPRASVARA